MKTCETCGNAMLRRPREAHWQFDKRRFCSKRCTGLALNPRKGAEDFKPRYRQVKTPDGRHLLEHRWVMEQHIGRPLRRTEHVHHINRDRLDNRIENLELVSPSEHGDRHTTLPKAKKCTVCGATFTPHKTKRRRAMTCSPECRGIQISRTLRGMQ